MKLSIKMLVFLNLFFSQSIFPVTLEELHQLYLKLLRIRIEIITDSNNENIEKQTIYDQLLDEYSNLLTQINHHQKDHHTEFKNFLANFPKLFQSTLNNNLEWNLLDGYWYLTNYFKGKLEENHVFPCLHFEDYKIHLMPKKEDLEYTILKIVNAAKKDPELLNLIASFKFINKYENYKIYDDFSMPIIIIYAATGKANAQLLLDKIYDLFKDQDGLDITPRWNEKVSSLIYFAQGNGDEKIHGRYAKYFEDGDYQGNGRVYFKSDVSGTHKDYHLINPNK